jgi:hypothetical protein
MNQSRTKPDPSERDTRPKVVERKKTTAIIRLHFWNCEISRTNS